MGLRYRGINIQEAYAQRDELILAARRVIETWSSGDLADAVNGLEAALEMRNRLANSVTTPRDTQIDGTDEEKRRAHFAALDAERKA